MAALLAAKPDLLRRIVGTRAVDADGRPLVLHHGTDAAFESFGKTRDLGTHFGSRAQAEKRIEDLTTERKIRRPGTRNRIVSAVLRSENPVLVPDDPGAWPPGYLINLFRRFIPDSAMNRLARSSEGDNAKRHVEVSAYVKGRLVAAGHDAILYRNVIESPGRSRSVDWSWCVFAPQNIVILGENLQADAMDVPADLRPALGVTAIPGDPRAIAGLRRRNGNLTYKADAMRFETETVAHLAAGGGDRIADGHSGARFALPLPDGERVFAEIMREIGRIVLVPDAKNPYEVMDGIDVMDDDGPVDRGRTRGRVFEWQAGEKISDTLIRVDRALAKWSTCIELRRAPRMSA
jgi:hypothetical protein